MKKITTADKTTKNYSVLPYLPPGPIQNIFSFCFSSYQVRHCLPHQSLVTAASFSPDQKQLATATILGHIRVWNISGDKPTCQQYSEDDSNMVSSMAFSPDGTLLASGSWDNTVIIWDTTNKKNHATYNHDKEVTCCTWSPCGNLLASSSSDKSIKLWSAPLKRLCVTLQNKAEVSYCQFSANGAYLVSASSDNRLNIWNMNLLREGLPSLHRTFSIPYSVSWEGKIFIRAAGIMRDSAFVTMASSMTRSTTVSWLLHNKNDTTSRTQEANHTKTQPQPRESNPPCINVYDNNEPHALATSNNGSSIVVAFTKDKKSCYTAKTLDRRLLSESNKLRPRDLQRALLFTLFNNRCGRLGAVQPAAGGGGGGHGGRSDGNTPEMTKTSPKALPYRNCCA